MPLQQQNDKNDRAACRIEKTEGEIRLREEQRANDEGKPHPYCRRNGGKGEKADGKMKREQELCHSKMAGLKLENGRKTGGTGCAAGRICIPEHCAESG